MPINSDFHGTFKAEYEQGLLSVQSYEDVVILWMLIFPNRLGMSAFLFNFVARK